MKSIQDEILLVIPYINGGQGNELELALTGWRKYCKSPLRIIVIGDYNPCIDSKAEYIEYARTQALKNQYVPNIDVARKLNKIYDLFHEEYDHFVLANDDEYPIKDFDYHFLTQVTFLQDKFMGNASAPTNYWSHDMYKTRQLLDKEKKPYVNYCNHHPFYFDMEKFHEMSMKFNLANNSAIRENLYYNYYEFKTVVNVNSIRTGIWDTIDTKKKVQAAIDNPNIKFICNSVAGWSKGLMEMIGNYYTAGSIEKKKIDSVLEKDEKIIVSFTSWKKRIDNCAHIVDLMLNQTLKPDKIILNLSTDEFPNKEEELPEELVKKQNDIFEIWWVKENTKAFKKVIPTLERYPDGIIISIDDDIEYPSNSIESLYHTYLSTGRNNPISAGKWDWEGGIHSHLGALSLFKKEMFYPYLEDLYINVTLANGIETIPFDDALYTYSALLNKRRYVQSTEISGNDLVRMSPKHFENRLLQQLPTEYHEALAKEHKILREYIETVYQVSYKDMLENSTERYYDSFGKKYNNEKAIISLTSWKARINTVYKTIDSLLDKCSGFHIVLVLAKEEFPKMIDELPDSLKNYVNDSKIEIFWVNKNYKAFKKVLFTMDKYRDVPVISADDDCIYTCNYAEELYKKWEKNKSSFVSVWIDNTTFVDKNKYKVPHTGGAGTLYPPYVFGKLGLFNLTNNILKITNQDDDYYTCLKIILKLNKCLSISKNWREIYKFHDSIQPLKKNKLTNRNEIYRILNLQMKIIS